MKRSITLILCVLMLLSLSPASYAALDLSFVENSPVYEMDVKNNVAFISSILETSDRAFHHELENDALFSSTKFNVVIPDYDGDAWPALTLSIFYTADDVNNTTDVTFHLAGKEYTFSGLLDKDRQTKLDQGALEQLIILFGRESEDFLAELVDYSFTFFDDDFNMVNIDQAAVPMTLHGDRDIEVTLGSPFIMDFVTIVTAYSSMDGPEYLDRAEATPMKITRAGAPTAPAATRIPVSTEYFILSAEVYAGEKKLNGPSVAAEDAILTLSDQTVADGVTVDFHYFKKDYHGTIRDGIIHWDNEPTIVGDATEMTTVIFNEGKLILLDFHVLYNGNRILVEHVYKSR